MKTNNTISISADDILAEIEGPIIWRPQAAALAGWKPKTMANVDARGDGCPNRFRHGNAIGYPARSFATWLADRLDKPLRRK